jgi:hypothetical protein
MRLSIRIDFNTEDERGWIHINTESIYFRGLLRFLYPGIPITLSDALNIEVDATAEFDKPDQKW